MINFTFEKKISDIPMILPIEMFIIEEETAAPEFVEEINEIVPTFQEEAPKQNETKAIEPELKEITSQEPIDQIIQDTNEEVLIDNSADKTNEFIIDEKIKPEIKSEAYERIAFCRDATKEALPKLYKAQKGEDPSPEMVEGLTATFGQWYVKTIEAVGVGREKK